jgi:hypothetical protein
MTTAKYVVFVFFENKYLMRVWDVDHLGRGLFYYEGEIIPSFLEIVT